MLIVKIDGCNLIKNTLIITFDTSNYNKQGICLFITSKQALRMGYRPRFAFE